MVDPLVWPPLGVEWPDDSAMQIDCGQALERFCPGDVKIDGQTYHLLTGFEDRERQCFWCGGELKGKLKRYCYGHMKLYYKHFQWNTANYGALERDNYTCQNCGFESKPDRWNHWEHPGLEVHHIVPLKGQERFFSAWNIPWNLIVFCHACHQEVHAIMRPRADPKPLDPWEMARKAGQGSVLCNEKAEEFRHRLRGFGGHYKQEDGIIG